MKSKLILSVLTAALLSACGGSSTNDNQAADKPNNNQAQNQQQPQQPQNPQQPQQPQQPEQPQQPQTPPADDAKNPLKIAARTGAYNGRFVQHYKPEGATTYISNSRETADNGNTTITFKGNTDRQPLRLPTFAADKKAGSILIFGSQNGQGETVKKEGLSYKSFQVSDDSYAHSQFGSFFLDNGYTAFYRGTPTTDMPTRGSALYKGESILAFRNEKGDLIKADQGKVEAEADFAEKRLGLTMTAPQSQYKVSTTAIISDSGFATTDLVSNRNVSIKGVFTGPAAAEMTGYYVDAGHAVEGVFGAKKQQPATAAQQ